MASAARTLADARHGLRADRRGVHGVALLPRDPGLVQPMDRARPDAARRRDRRAHAAGVRPRGGLAEPDLTPQTARSARPATSVRGRRARTSPATPACSSALGARDVPDHRRADADARHDDAPRPARGHLRSRGADGVTLRGRQRRRRLHAGPPRPARRSATDRWGRGANRGFHTLLPYDAQVAKDGTIWPGLQDNGEMKIEPDGRQFMTYGGDGASAPSTRTTATIAYEEYVVERRSARPPTAARRWTSVAPPDDTGYQFINPFVMDPSDASAPAHGGHEGSTRRPTAPSATGRRSTTSARAPSPATDAAAGVERPGQRRLGGRRPRRRHARCRPAARRPRTSTGRAARTPCRAPRGPTGVGRPAPTPTARSRSRRARPTARRRSR